MFNIMVEGCDCVGKTTFIDLFCARHPEYERVKSSAPSDLEDGYLLNVGIVDRLNNKKPVIFDRGLLGECVYAPLMRGYYPYYMRKLESRIKPYSVLLLLEANESVVKERFDGLFITREMIPDILFEFGVEYVLSNFPFKKRIDTSYKSPVDCVREFEKWLSCLRF